MDPATQRRVWLAVGLTIICGFGWYARDVLAFVLSNVAIEVLLLAVIFGLASTILQGMTLASLAAKNGARSGDSRIAIAYLISQPAKYIPGKIWLPIVQAGLLRRDVGLGVMAVANVELSAVIAVQMITLGVVCLRPTPAIAAGVVLCGITVSSVLIWFPTGEVVQSRWPSVARRLRLGTLIETPTRTVMLRATVLSCGAMAIGFAASLFLVLAAGPAVPTGGQFSVLSVFYLGFASSLLVVFMPGGLGVREAATAGLGLLLSPDIPSSVIISISILARGWQLVVDFLSLTIGSTLCRGDAQ